MQKYEQFISYIMKLKTNNLTFSSTDSLLQKWLDTTYTEFSVLGILEVRYLYYLVNTFYTNVTTFWLGKRTCGHPSLGKTMFVQKFF